MYVSTCERALACVWRCARLYVQRPEEVFHDYSLEAESLPEPGPHIFSASLEASTPL